MLHFVFCDFYIIFVITSYNFTGSKVISRSRDQLSPGVGSHYVSGGLLVVFPNQTQFSTQFFSLLS